ncbi:nucleoside diphosphate-linked moiety X motif 8 [Galendromus occidentalis]|uniref:Nucleoside diphosphate-linked moiety X motif 8 n=1 Tax=Galendromus occidentalis TaxID=34638 RepID=A0AAJ6QPF0_9ACAR|nr:nucleoside diphosphate-linked moiety X motif 8 [Galendromus occidentalis]
MLRRYFVDGSSVSFGIRRLSTDIFSPANLQRTLRELNEPKIAEKAFGTFTADGKARQSAVLIPLCLHKKQPSILFNLRSNKLTRHKGYPCFPGGVAEEADRDSTHTALRETEEELGIKSGDVEVIGAMPRFKLPRDKMEITAIIANIGDIDSHKLDINYDEVSVVFSRTVEELCDPKNIGETSFRGAHKDVIYSSPVFIAGDYKIWGVTGMLLHLFLGRLVPEFYRKPARPLKFRRFYESGAAVA